MAEMSSNLHTPGPARRKKPAGGASRSNPYTLDEPIVPRKDSDREPMETSTPSHHRPSMALLARYPGPLTGFPAHPPYDNEKLRLHHWEKELTLARNNVTLYFARRATSNPYHIKENL